jgi:hypothetical protein
MPSSIFKRTVLIVLTFISIAGVANVSEARSIKNWPGYVQGWGNTCSSQFKGCTNQASEIYDACVSEKKSGCSRGYDLDYAGCQKDNRSCQKFE